MSDERSLADQGYVKVRMADGGHTETVWAQRVAGDASTFRLDNAPFFAYCVSADDVVEASVASDGIYEVVRVVERSGNRTVRLSFGADRADSPAGTRILEDVGGLGCSYEGMNNRLVSITVPPSVDLDVVVRYLTATGLRWEYADPTYADLFGAH